MEITTIRERQDPVCFTFNSAVVSNLNTDLQKHYMVHETCTMSFFPLNRRNALIFNLTKDNFSHVSQCSNFEQTLQK